MPELPEVETVRRSLSMHLEGQRIGTLDIREPRLRWPIPEEIGHFCSGQKIVRLSRRAKYLILELERGGLLVHLGMTGHLRIVRRGLPPGKHDHWDLCLTQENQQRTGQILRYHDPRRFGALDYLSGTAESDPRLASLGPEPFDPILDGPRFFEAIRSRRAPIRNLLLDGHLIAGIGNIYANEALFLAKIHPATPGQALEVDQCLNLLSELRQLLLRAIEAGGSSISDFVGSDGRPGYFQFSHAVYGREGLLCPLCQTPIKTLRLSQRSAFFCPRCQPLPSCPQPPGISDPV